MRVVANHFKDRYALSLGVYYGSWGLHIYIDFLWWSVCLEFGGE
ncbi:unnamed protein product [marine sediment metagenome]|uniref:Uncharacterized protein n=1 Tax=marine sediment metagenome TaxID=412755 RepID=X1TSS2_9ZZZZ